MKIISSTFPRMVICLFKKDEQIPDTFTKKDVIHVKTKETPLTKKQKELWEKAIFYRKLS